MEQLKKHQIILESSIWLSVCLNLLPGLGTGYIYQRRWKAYWVTSIISLFWILWVNFSTGFVDPLDPAKQALDGEMFLGLSLISIATAVEAGYAVGRLRSLKKT